MTFHPYRTAKSIMQHWLQMKHYQLLDDQTGIFLDNNMSNHDFAVLVSYDV
jgi:hypothetical protein